MKEDRLAEYLPQRGQMRTPPSLVDHLMEAIPPREHRRWLGVNLGPLLAACAAGLLLFATVLWASGGITAVGSASPSPSETALPSVSPEPSALATHTVAPTEGSIGEVAVSSLPIRVEADDEAPVVHGLREGDLVSVLESSNDWYRIEFPYPNPETIEYMFGWIRTNDAEKATLRDVDLGPCPEALLPTLAAMPPQERLRCYGTEPLTLRGWAIAYSNSVAIYSGTPGWLAAVTEIGLMSVPSDIGGPALPVRLDPEIADPWPVGSELNVVGHFGDERSGSCRRTAPPDFSAEANAESALWCRQQFVVERFDLP